MTNWYRRWIERQFTPNFGRAYARIKLTWTYFGTGAEQYYDGDVSGAERSPTATR